MPFNKEAFMSQEFVERSERVVLPSLDSWFGEDEEPSFLVRGLNATELSLSANTANTDKTVNELVESLTNSEDVVNEIKNLLGVNAIDIPSDVRIRMFQLETCCIEPKLESFEVGKLAEAYPVEFFKLTNVITKLTGLGLDLKK